MSINYNKNQRKEMLKRRKENRLREFYKVSNVCAKAFNIDKEIKIKEMSGADINKIKDRIGIIDCVEFKREYLHVHTGLLEIDFIPNIVIRKLLALEMAHLYYKDYLLGNVKKDFLFMKNLKFPHIKAMLIVFSELRADIAATQVMGLKTEDEIEMSNMYSGFDLVTCYKVQGYPDRELRNYICKKYNKFSRELIEEVFYIYRRKLTEQKIRFNITLEDIDKFVGTLNSEWQKNWPQKSDNDDIHKVQNIVRNLEF